MSTCAGFRSPYIKWWDAPPNGEMPHQMVGCPTKWWDAPPNGGMPRRSSNKRQKNSNAV